MHELMEDLYELCETLGEEIGTANEKIKLAGGELKGSDVEYIDKLTHSLKSIKAVMAMIEDEGEYSNQGGGSNRSYARGGNRGGGNRGGGRGGSNRGGSNRGSNEGSYARRRDSMGRYSREGYSRAADELVDQLEDLMEQAPNEQVKKEFERLIQKMENA